MLARVETHSRILGDLAEIEAVAAQWRALEARCADPMAYFQTYDWCRQWIARYGQDGRHLPHVATLWRGDRLVAVWPLAIGQGGGLRRLLTLGAPHSQYCGLLAEPELDPLRDIKPMIEAALQQSGCDVAVFHTVPQGSALADALGDLDEVAGAGNEASMLDLSRYASSQDYTAQLGKLQKRNRNRRRNHLARAGELDFSVIWPGDAEFSDLVLQCAAWKRQWLSEMGLFSAGFAMPGYDRFMAGLSGDPVEKSGACLSVLCVGGTPVAIELGFVRQGHYYAYMGGFDWSLRDLSPGKVQMDMTVCWLIDNGIATYDLLTNSADYKKSWSSRSVATSCRARALTWKGRVYASTWLPRLRPAVKQLRNNLPEIQHKAASWGRGAACLLLYV